MSYPGWNRSFIHDTAGYDKDAVEYVLRGRTWQSWHEILEWLRADGVGDPYLSQQEVQALRQDMERAATRGAPLPEDPDRMWHELKR